MSSYVSILRRLYCGLVASPPLELLYPESKLKSGTFMAPVHPGREGCLHARLMLWIVDGEPDSNAHASLRLYDPSDQAGFGASDGGRMYVELQVLGASAPIRGHPDLDRLRNQMIKFEPLDSPDLRPEHVMVARSLILAARTLIEAPTK